MDRAWECGRHVRLPPRAHERGVRLMPSDLEVCPFCAERIEAAAVRCGYCGSAVTSLSGPLSLGPPGDKEVLGREPKGSRGLITAVGILVVVPRAHGAIRGGSRLPPPHHPPERPPGGGHRVVTIE